MAKKWRLFKSHRQKGLPKGVDAVNYALLNPQCGYCGGPASVIRTTVTSGGEILNATLCWADAHGEAESMGRAQLVADLREAHARQLSPKDGGPETPFWIQEVFSGMDPDK